MDTSSQTPRRRGSHFSDGKRPDPAPKASPTPRRPSASPAPAPAPIVTPDDTGVVGGGVSSRTAAATRRAGSHSVKRAERGGGRGRLPLVIAALVLVAVVCVGVFVVPSLLNGGGDTDRQEVVPGSQVTITIPEGSGAGVVAQLLYDNGVIASQSEFLAFVRRTEAEANLKSGTYSITTGAELSTIVTLLTTGPNASSAQLTVPEGRTVGQTAALVQDSLGIPSDEFLAQAKASNYVADFPFLSDVTNDSLEGYLFPKTYDFSGKEVTADLVIRAMLAQYQTEVASIDLAAVCADLSARYGIELNEDDVITMASIVEREAVTDEQRGKIASVFYNRLADGMALQSDATLVYSLNREVTAADLEVDDPYNTYTRTGLTPTPVCSPSLASIQAAAYPEDTSYFYFYITNDYEAFSETYDEHLQAIANDA